MNQDEPTNRDKPLSAVLQSWRVDASLPPRFEEGVWRRIAAAQQRSRASGGFWLACLSRWEKLVQKPLGAVACLAVFAALGVGLGLWHSQAFAARVQTAWQDAYVESVSPTTVTLTK